MFNLSHVNELVGLLVSVRSADEARIALEGGAEVIDVKEPTRGSLGAADAAVVDAVVAAVGGRAPVSVAGGELLAREAWHGDSIGVTYAKVGLAGCGVVADWRGRWRAANARLPAHIAPVAVAYADWRRAVAPPPDDVLAEAIRLGCPAVLVDTWDKSAGGLFDHWSPGDVAWFCRQTRTCGLAIVLAGSLRIASLDAAVRCAPNLIAVRGAACDGDRNGPISAARIRAVRLRLKRASAASERPGEGAPAHGEVASPRR